MRAPGYEQLKQAVTNLGHRWFEGGNYNLNLVGVRSVDAAANTFNDLFCVAFADALGPKLFAFACSTDPGLFYRGNPLNLRGTAVVKPGQYPGLWKTGMHQGKYSALVQAGPITVYRDGNRDGVVDADGIEDTGFFGINCHRAAASGPSHQVDKWSAGCQVLAQPLDFMLLMALVRQAAIRYGDRHTYTLITEGDL